MFTELILTTQMQVIRVYCLLLIVFVFHIRVIPYKITGFIKKLGNEHLGFSSFLNMLIHAIGELQLQNYSSVTQIVPEIWLT